MKWEYRVEDTLLLPLSTDKMAELGREGWELCGVVKWMGFTYYFKRPING